MSFFKDQLVQELIDSFRAEEVVRLLLPLISERRQKRIEEVLAARLQSIHVAVEAPYDIHNALAVVRTAEALGVSHMHIIASEVRKKAGQGTTKGSIHWAHLKDYKNSETFLMSRPQGFLLAGASLEGSVPLEDLPIEQPLMIVFGNEHRGLSQEMLKACDYRFRIPMYGMVESYNLSVSAAITLYDIVKRRRARIKTLGDLSQEELINERAFCYIRGIGMTKAAKILRGISYESSSHS